MCICFVLRKQQRQFELFVEMADLDDIDIEEQQLVRKRKKRSPDKAAASQCDTNKEHDSKQLKKVLQRKSKKKVLQERVSIECPEDADVADGDDSITTPAHAASPKRMRARNALNKRCSDFPPTVINAADSRCSDHALVLFAMRDKHSQRALTAFNEHWAAVQIQRIARGSSISP